MHAHSKRVGVRFFPSSRTIPRSDISPIQNGSDRAGVESWSPWRTAALIAFSMGPNVAQILFSYSSSCCAARLATTLKSSSVVTSPVTV